RGAHVPRRWRPHRVARLVRAARRRPDRLRRVLRDGAARPLTSFASAAGISVAASVPAAGAREALPWTLPRWHAILSLQNLRSARQNITPRTVPHEPSAA